MSNEVSFITTFIFQVIQFVSSTTISSSQFLSMLGGAWNSNTSSLTRASILFVGIQHSHVISLIHEGTEYDQFHQDINDISSNSGLSQILDI
jgi:hypothetical protein